MPSGIVGSELKPRICPLWLIVSFAPIPHVTGAGGAGLGLALVKWIVEAHQGEVKARSQPDQWTEFHISRRSSFPAKSIKEITEAGIDTRFSGCPMDDFLKFALPLCSI
ncbi:MAG: hypothetical protein MZV64_34505 [Ignavibacteriales bacterium]|nr:hypothetical protein [Ignavibacteriales bacterium]